MIDPFSIILLVYLETARCVGVEHPNPKPPTVTYTASKWLRCARYGKCRGLYWGSPTRRIKIAGGSASMALLRHEMTHDLLWQRDRILDRKHLDPAFHKCVF